MDLIGAKVSADISAKLYLWFKEVPCLPVSEQRDIGNGIIIDQFICEEIDVLENKPYNFYIIKDFDYEQYLIDGINDELLKPSSYYYPSRYLCVAK